MKHLLSLYALLLVILFCSAVTYEGFESSPSTLFSDIANKKVLLLIYSTKCGHCTAMKPAWDAAEKKQPSKMVSIDATNDTDESIKAIMTKLNVNSYPSIFVMNNGKPTAYTGGRTEKDFLNEVNSM